MTVAVQTSSQQTIAPPGRWTVDARHSAVSFTAEQPKPASVIGEFREFEGALEVDRDGAVRAHGAVEVQPRHRGAGARSKFAFERLLRCQPLPGDPVPASCLPSDRLRNFRMLGELDIGGVTRQVVLRGTARRYEALGLRRASRSTSRWPGLASRTTACGEASSWTARLGRRGRGSAGRQALAGAPHRLRRLDGRLSVQR